MSCLTMKVGLNERDRQEMEDRVLEKTNGGPRGVFNTLADLKAVYPDGTYGIFLILNEVPADTRGHHYYFFKDGKWTDGGYYLASDNIDDVNKRIDLEIINRTNADKVLDDKVEAEIERSEARDIEMQEQIDALENKSDVVIVFASKAQLNAYDINKLFLNDIAKVLRDESEQGKNGITYYKVVGTETAKKWEFIGGLGEYYTKAEAKVIHDALEARVRANEDFRKEYKPKVDKNTEDIKQVHTDLTYNRVGLLKATDYNDKTGIIELTYDESVVNALDYDDASGIVTITYE